MPAPPQSPPLDTATEAPSVAFVSLGCPKNLVDSETMLGTLETTGFHLVDSDQPADAIVINTCGFLESSKQESLEVINEAIGRKHAGEIGRVVVAGCLVQRHRAKLLEWAPGIDAMIGVFDRDHILDAVTGDGGAALRETAAGSVGDDSAAQRAAPPEPTYWITGNALQAARERGRDTVGLTVNGADGRGVGYFESDANRYRLTPRHWAYLRVSEGCNQRCAFCTIPSIRGKMRSKPMDRIVDEARRLMRDGAFELNLIGQDTTSYGYDIYGRHRGTEGSRDRGIEASSDEQISIPLLRGAGEGRGGGNYSGDLIGLLRALNDVADEHGGGWMRLMYVYPTYFTDEMIDAIAMLPNICKYIDIPLQHMSDRMLTTMRRNITREQQETLLHKLRERIPGLAIRTTFITGYPGETDEDHQELLDFVDEFGFDMMGVFRYSREDGTPAGTMDLDPALHVSDDVKAEREQELMETQQHIAFENAAYVAEEACQFDVLIDAPQPADADAAVGRCYFQAPQVDSVTHVVSARPLAAGELVRCTIVGSDGYDLIAEPTDERRRIMSLPIAGTE